MVRRWLPVRPVAWRNAEPSDPVHPPSAGRAIEHELAELPLEVALHVQKLEAKHLRMERDVVGVAESRVERLVHQRVRGRSLLAHGPHRDSRTLRSPRINL
jgi:hypothetical protein